MKAVPKAQRIKKENVLKKREKLKPARNVLYFRSFLFGDRQRGRVCADNSADGNIMDEATLRRIESARSQVDVQTVDQRRVFDMVATTLESTRANLAYT